MTASALPLDGIKVLDFAQFLAGPAAALRLADLGADVVKIERPQGGDLCRQLAIANAYAGEDSLLFHTFNRNKRSTTADLKSPADLEAVKRLITAADVMIHNFRPGVMEKIGLGYEVVSELNPQLIYASVSGYGSEGPLRDKPGQDLLAQSISGLAWLSGNQDAPPTPVGLPVLDMAAAGALTQGILAALVRRAATGKGGRVEVDLLSVAIDMQYEPLTAFLNNGEALPQRCAVSNANIYSTAPYGIYATADGYLTLAMAPLARLAELMEMPELTQFAAADAYRKRDDIKQIIADRVAQRRTAEWLAILEPADIWCAEVQNWQQLVCSDAFRAIDMVQEVHGQSGATRTTCCPIKIDGKRLKSPRAAPPLGAHNDEVFGAASKGKKVSALLDKLLVVDLSQFLAGPYASLRLQDLGARVIKVEKPQGGDLCRKIYLSDTDVNGDSTIFHAINRGKESLALDLKAERDAARLRALLRHADVVIQNFRPGVIERLGFGYEAAAAINPRIVYASISGYGADGPWANLPGQDLLAQARSGAMWLSGNADDGPVPFGVAVADIMTGANAAQGILAALVRRGISGQGAHIETSLLEAMADLQFEALATHLNDGGRLPQRAAAGSAHAGLAAPYGIYCTADGYLAIAMAPLNKLARIFDSEALLEFAHKPSAWFQQRDDIKSLIAGILEKKSSDDWLAALIPEDIWCAPILSWHDLLKEETFLRLQMVQSVPDGLGQALRLMRSPIRIDGKRAASAKAAPAIGADNARLFAEFGL